MKQRSHINVRAAWWILPLLLALCVTGCATKAQRTELKLESDPVVLPPELDDASVSWNGQMIQSETEVEPPGKLRVELRGTPGVDGVVEHAGGRGSLAETSPGLYVAEIDVPGGSAGRYPVNAWLTDPQSTPNDSRKVNYALRLAPPPPPPTADPRVEMRKKAAAELKQIGRVTFEPASDVIDASYDVVLDGWAAVIKKYDQLDFVIVASCDENGTDDYNNVLGVRRAVFTKTKLVERGIEGARLGISSLGKAKAENCSEKSPEGRGDCWAADRFSMVEPF